MRRKYTIAIAPLAKRQLSKLPKTVKAQLMGAINGLALNAIPKGALKIKEQRFRIRKGNYRIIYKVIKKEIVVLILQVGHRKEIYKRL